MNDLFSNSHVSAAVYFTDQGHYIFKYKSHDRLITKNLRAQEVSSAFTLETMDSGWITPGIQRTGFNSQGDWFVYYMPACRLNLYLDESGTRWCVPIPPTVLIGVKKTIYLFAMAGTSFDPKGKVYTAPFPNIHSDGKVCWGKNQAPQVDPKKAKDAWFLFFNTPFNGDLAADKCKKFPKDVRDYLKFLAGKQTYPTNTMRVCYASLDGLVERLVVKQ
jgi:hypothetical protein